MPQPVITNGTVIMFSISILLRFSRLEWSFLDSPICLINALARQTGENKHSASVFFLIRCITRKFIR
ncbi:hypothetical protein XBFFL1_2300005 [Xenorhabdus bovienii str. feltiae Florida]|nr:hypothetical protein XBFFL1_2300005 [Xenorhabdus bovienii str. feltiae Florida]